MSQSRTKNLEMMSWLMIIIATFATVFFFPWYVADSLLRYIIFATVLIAVFWYIKSRRLYTESQRKTHDIQAKQKRIISEQKAIDLIFKNSADGILVLDNAQRIINFSPGLERITGFLQEEVLDKQVKEVLKFIGDGDNSLLPDVMFLPNTIKKQPYVKNSLLTRDGREIDIEASYTLIQDESHEVKSLAIIRDVTYENQLVRRDKEFIAITSHQLNTPLSIIQGYLSLLKSEKVGKINKEQQDYIEEMIAATTKMIAITNHLLSISRIEQEKIKLEQEDVNVNDLFAKLNQHFENVAKAKHLELTFSSVPNNLLVYADEDKLRQALSNLIDNSIKYTQKGGIEVRVKEAGNRHIQFIVSDSGIGIPAEEMDKIGQKFYRSQNAIDLDNQGTGLGLFIAQTIIEKHGSKLEIESELNKGSKFSFSLPTIS